MSGFSPFGATPDGGRSQAEVVWHYLRPGHSSADASWEGASEYTRPDYDAADASFVQLFSVLYLGATQITALAIGSTPITSAYLGSTKVFESV